MLHLTVGKGEHIMIGDEVKVTYTKNDGKRVVALGINAPRSLKITRGNIYEDELEKMALSGDREAIERLTHIREENENRRKLFNQRKSKRQYIGGKKAREANTKKPPQLNVTVG